MTDRIPVGVIGNGIIGHGALTLMPQRPHSSAIARVMWITAALLMA